MNEIFTIMPSAPALPQPFLRPQVRYVAQYASRGRRITATNPVSRPSVAKSARTGRFVAGRATRFYTGRTVAA